ncbi:type II secretion system protein E [Capsulimonas corticalis]|uniref:Type II secretion system protein E n=1 Tax=Capsulimonas corticalis TaxID=2219043 RepID=A0A402CR14_9BACT|nr:ATPase, T2SS/T4P/T4SS family [Capsulimonas corticalis]BDI34449.1 type II secretion system protein E [Capsulimonas corticalis]
MKILIAEDDPISALVLRKALERMGHEVTVETNGAKAWTALQNGAFRLVLSDWMMPQMDGLELCHRIRMREGAPYVYLILLTVKGNAEDRTEALDAGIDDFLVKPLDSAELVARIEVAQRILKMKDELKLNTGQLESLSGELREQHMQLGNLLVDHGVITPEQLHQALTEQTQSRERLGAILLAHGWVTETHITQARSRQMDVPFVAVERETPDPFVLALVPFDTARRHQMLPLSVQDFEGSEMGRLRLAMVNPWDIEAIDLVQRTTRRRVEPYLASKPELMEAIEQAYHGVDSDAQEDVLSDSIQAAATDLLSEDLADEIDTAELMRQSDQAPIIRFVNTLFADAVARRTSDIHIEPQKRNFQILYRIDGRLQPIRTVPRQFLAPTTSRIKIMADMDISERRLPLDGRIALRIHGRPIDLRISTLPTHYGERVAMRILDRANACLSLEQIGFTGKNAADFQDLINKPHGLILVTGPTGSGKTSTLYAALNALKSTSSPGVAGRRNIITCEDPIEYELEGISQSAVNERAGLTFARQLRAILRQDPDVVLVGEIRDAETAEIAMRASLTGHLVLSTLHCNEAAGAVSRLLDMGIPEYLIASTLIGSIAQRLVRRLCPHCRREVPVEPATAAQYAGDAPNFVYEPAGCPQCDNQGTKGRLAVHEVLTVDRDIRKLIMQASDTKDIRQAAIRGGMVTMFADGLEKAAQGLTTIGDVHAKVSSIGDDDEDAHTRSAMAGLQMLA